MRIVIALGGNALLRRGEPLDTPTQVANARIAAAALAPLTAEHELVITHGNGPQVGLLAVQSAPHSAAEPGTPLDVLSAESEGQVGYVLTQELGNALPGRDVVNLMTRVVVDRADPAFLSPSKPIGPAYETKSQAWTAAHAHGWVVAQDGRWWRRVVASPKPREIVELDAIRLLVEAGMLVVCAGGGGVPVVRSATGTLQGTDAVIDKDRTAALLAERLNADALLLLTDVDGIQLGWGSPHPVRLPSVDAAELTSLGLPSGSMHPKAAAAARFARNTGAIAAIGRLQDAAAVLAGEAGTRVSATGVAV